MRGGECPVIPPVHWKGVAFPRQRSSRTLKTLANLRAYIVCFLQFEISVFEICLKLVWLVRFFDLCLKDLLIKFSEIPK